MWCLSESKTTLWRWIWNVPPPPPLSSDCQLSSYGQQHSRQSSLRCLYISTGEICKSSCSGDPVSGDVTSSHDPCVISVAPEDTHILHIPFQKLKRIFSKSSQILSNTASNIHKFGDNVYYVASKPSLDNPHKVIHRGNGKFICDTSCVNWATYKFCAHTLALAEVSEETRLFLNKVAMEAKPDATSLALLDMLKGRGKKGADRATTRRKGGPVRKKSCVVETWHYTNSENSNHFNIGQHARVSTPTLPTPCSSSISMAVPQPPLDLVIVGKMRRKYTQDGGKRLSKKSNVYFHAAPDCVKKRAPVFIPALLTFHPADIKESFRAGSHWLH